MDTEKSKSKVTSGQSLSLEEQALVRQWMEYKKVVLDQIGPQAITHVILMHLNSELADRSYLAGNSYTNADKEVFNGLFPFYVSQSLQTKEKYLHLSRWFCHIQHKCLTKETAVTFSRSLLY